MPEKPSWIPDLEESTLPVVEQLLNKTWDELEVLEHAGYLLFPEKLYKRRKDGTWAGVNVCLRVPKQADFRKARIRTRQIATEEGLSLEHDQDLLSDLEDVCILTDAIRNTTPPHEAWEPDPRGLEKRYDASSLKQLWAKLEALVLVIDPAPDKITEDEFFALVCALSKERTIAPLAVYGSAAQTYSVVTMADRLLTLLAPKLSLEQSEHSTQES